MSDSTALRRRAYAQFLELKQAVQEKTLLPSADRILAAAEECTGLFRQAVSPNDPLLAGAHAVLDREMGAVWFARSDDIPESAQRFAQAHEFAHFWLHPGPPSGACHVEDGSDSFPEAPWSTGGHALAEGYSPAERREREANLFAAELLLPLPVLYRLFAVHGWTAAQIAAHSGLAETCVLAQLTAALGPAPDPLPGATEAATPATESTESVLKSLDPGQSQAARIARGPVLIDAGPGAGKTRALTARVLHLVLERQVPPENLLALTFSQLAAEEMRARLRALIGPDVDRIGIGTFHAFGFELLRRDGARLGIPLRPRLLDTADAMALLEEHLDRLPLCQFFRLNRPSLPFPDILRCIARAKDELSTPEDYRQAALSQAAEAVDERACRAAARSLEVAEIYAVYQQLLQERRCLDFGDLILRAVELLDSHPDVQRRWREQFPHILADEYQDINRASARLLQRLAGEGAGFWAVGDIRQAIYRFRGASPANVREFERDFPGGMRLRLDRNYRSRPPIVTLFSAVARAMDDSDIDQGKETQHNERRNRRDDAWKEEGREEPAADSLLWLPMRPRDSESGVTLAFCRDEEAQADGLAAQIRIGLAAGIRGSDHAILCRTNRQCADLSRRLEARGIETLSYDNLFERTEARDMLALLSLAAGPEGTALWRVARFPAYRIPEKDILLLLETARLQERAFPHALAIADEIPTLSAAGREGFRRLCLDLQPILFRGDAWLLLARYLFETSDYLRNLLRSGASADQGSVLALRSLLEFVQGVARKTTREETDNTPHRSAMSTIRRLQEYRELKAPRMPASGAMPGRVRLMTVHAAKGLEFPVVMLPNLIEGQFPPRGQSSMVAPPPALSSSEGEAEETAGSEECLFFVALSRARDRLILSVPSTWRGRPTKPSPLLLRLEQALVQSRATRTEWSGGAQSEDDPERSPAGTAACDTLPTLSAAALEQYQKCPRQYYYQRVLRLPPPVRPEPYLEYHRAIQETLRRAAANPAESGGPHPDLASLRGWMREVWPETPEENAHARLLRRHAEAVLPLLQGVPEDGIRTVADLELVADLPNGRAVVVCDSVEELPDGTLRILRRRHTQPDVEDLREPRLALMRRAAGDLRLQRPPQIAVHYVGTGERQEAPENRRYEPDRVAKYDVALEGIRRGEFAAKPEERLCAYCPFYFICPA